MRLPYAKIIRFMQGLQKDIDNNEKQGIHMEGFENQIKGILRNPKSYLDYILEEPPK